MPRRPKRRLSPWAKAIAKHLRSEMTGPLTARIYMDRSEGDAVPYAVFKPSSHSK